MYVLGGAITAQQCLKASLVDELQIHLVPVLCRSPRAIGSERSTHLRHRGAS